MELLPTPMVLYVIAVNCEFWGYCCHVLVLQARPNQLQCGLLSASCVILKVICIGVGWVWHTRLVMFHIFVSLCTSHIPQLTDTLAQTEQELEDLKLAQARMEANNSARIAAQSAGIPLVCTEGFICSVYMHWVHMAKNTCRKQQ